MISTRDVVGVCEQCKYTVSHTRRWRVVTAKSVWKEKVREAGSMNGLSMQRYTCLARSSVNVLYIRVVYELVKGGALMNGCIYVFLRIIIRMNNCMSKGVLDSNEEAAQNIERRAYVAGG